MPELFLTKLTELILMLQSDLFYIIWLWSYLCNTFSDTEKVKNENIFNKRLPDAVSLFSPVIAKTTKCKYSFAYVVGYLEKHYSIRRNQFSVYCEQYITLHKLILPRV